MGPAVSGICPVEPPIPAQFHQRDPDVGTWSNAACVVSDRYQRISGPIRGTMMMGRVLDTEMVDRLVQQTRIGFKIWPVIDRDIPAEGLAALGRMRPGGGPIVVERDADTLAVYVVQPGLDRGLDLLIGAELPRAISTSGAISTRYAAISLILVGVATALILLFVLQRVVVRPITELTKQLTTTGDGRESTARIATQRSDEIGNWP